MNAAQEWSSGPGPWRPGLLWVFLAGSVALHALALLAVRQTAPPTTRAARPIEMVVVEVQKPALPAVEPQRPKPPPPKLVLRTRPPPPRPALPPPPNQTPAAPAPETPPPPTVVGLTLESTTTGGTLAAPVGNTLYGKTAEKAVAPADVKPLPLTPLYQVDSQPAVLSEVKIPYPEDARRQGIEGTVVLAITVDAEGNVVAARALSGPGHGLNDAAERAIRRFRFRPAHKAGQSVDTEMKYAYTFLLD